MHVGGLHGHDGEPFFSKNQMPLIMAWMVYAKVVLGVHID
jgi:hypothetical protein